MFRKQKTLKKPGNIFPAVHKKYMFQRKDSSAHRATSLPSVLMLSLLRNGMHFRTDYSDKKQMSDSNIVVFDDPDTKLSHIRAVTFYTVSGVVHI